MARKRRKKRGNGLFAFAVVMLFVAATVYFRQGQEREYSGEFGIELAIPQFTKSVKSQIIEHTGYTVSYNEQRRNANWVAYELTAQEVEGIEARDDNFVPDPLVTGRQATTADYRRSGWDRGHLAPAADMKWSRQAMEESFYMSNISPQNHNLNSGVWKSIEELVRDKAREYNRVLVVTGPVFASKKGLGEIGDNRVLIPNGFYKVLLIFDKGYHGIGFYCENKSGRKELKEYAATIDEIEDMTGIDFFHSLPDETESEVEAVYDYSVWESPSH